MCDFASARAKLFRSRLSHESVFAMNPNPDYDASDELEYGIAAYAWLLRGVYPPPSYAPDLDG